MFLRRRIAVINVDGPKWGSIREQVGIHPGVSQAVCLGRLTDRGALRRLRRGIYAVVDPVRETPLVAIASGACSHLRHYVTTDAAFAFHGLLDQPLSRITVAAVGRMTPIPLGSTEVRIATITDARYRLADRYDTVAEAFPVSMASRAQAALDALAEPRWMVHMSLLSEMLATFTSKEIDWLANSTLRMGSAPSQRLGSLLEDAAQPIPTELQAFVPRGRAVQLVPGRRGSTFSTRWRVYG